VAPLRFLLPTYNRLLYLDADMSVRPLCPDWFVCVPLEAVGGEKAIPPTFFFVAFGWGGWHNCLV
jgi:hypothetical protein